MPLLILRFVLRAILLLLIYLPIHTKCHFENLDGLWYVEKKNGRIGQWFNPLRVSINNVKYILNKEKKRTGVESLLVAFSKLESGKTYQTETHLLPHLQRYKCRKKIKVKKCIETRKRYIWEYIFVWGFTKYFFRRIAKDSKLDTEIYKQFYNIEFEKL